MPVTIRIPWPFKAIAVTEVGIKIMDQDVPDITGPVDGRIELNLSMDGSLAALKKEQSHRFSMSGKQGEIKAVPGSEITKGKRAAGAG